GPSRRARSTSRRRGCIARPRAAGSMPTASAPLRSAKQSSGETGRPALEAAPMARRVRFGVTLPQIKRSWEEARAAAVAFDRLGFDSVWVCDHLYGVPLPTLPIFEAWTELAASAAEPERAGRVRLGGAP